MDLIFFPRFNDIFTQNALWRSLYFENGDKNEISLRVESAEGNTEINGKFSLLINTSFF